MRNSSHGSREGGGDGADLAVIQLKIAGEGWKEIILARDGGAPAPASGVGAAVGSGPGPGFIWWLKKWCRLRAQ
jgi:hypothetical protein